MKKNTEEYFKLRITVFILIITITAGINNSYSLIARTKTDKSILTVEKNPVKKEKITTDPKSDTLNKSIEINPANIDKKTPAAKDANISTDIKNGTLKKSNETTPAIVDIKTPEVKDKNIHSDEKIDTSKTPVEITPAISDKKTSEIIDRQSIPEKKDQIYINAEEITNHPEIILKAYKDAYPALITDVSKGENDWMVKFSNGNIYYWAEGKILPESVLTKSDKYTRYSIYPYNMNGRSPELYTKEKIEELTVKEKPSRKKQFIPGVEGGLYKELFSITNKKSAKKQLTEVKLSGHYITVHRNLAEKIKTIDSKIKLLAKTDLEVKSYLKNIGSVEAFNWRKIAGTDRKSNHSFGIALDILPKKYRKKILYWSWEQEKNEKWMLLPQKSLWTPPDPVVKIFLDEGFIWGGHWDRYDTMHFEYRPELIFLFKNLKFGQKI